MFHICHFPHKIIFLLRGGKSRLAVEKPLIVYKEQGVYTDEIYDIYGY